ncbi:MAG TPA: hypothetical protein VE465_18010 [Streptosporangiaceae bacterium]|nr:hypothetical protein [Streptosporangiaceae bacterium]
MTCTLDRAMLHVKANNMTKLIALIQAYPVEARRIVDAVEDGLTLGPAFVFGDGCQLDDAVTTCCEV